jgi:hypothetical protein
MARLATIGAIGVVVALWAAAALAATPLTPGVWKAPNGNTLTIETIDQASGALAGRFLVAAPQTADCQTAGSVHALGGWYNRDSDVITFSINVPQSGCKAVITWAGHYDEATQAIQVQWMRVSGSDGTMMLGVARFARAPDH